MGLAGARDMYRTGRGSVLLRAKAHTERLSSRRRDGGGQGREAVVVTELPYNVAKNKLLSRVAELVNDKKLVGISEIRDESSLDGIRIVFELRRDADAAVVLNNLFKQVRPRDACMHAHAHACMQVT